MVGGFSEVTLNRDLKEVQSAEERLFQAEEQQVQTVPALHPLPELPWVWKRQVEMSQRDRESHQ